MSDAAPISPPAPPAPAPTPAAAAPVDKVPVEGEEVEAEEGLTLRSLVSSKEAGAFPQQPCALCRPLGAR